MPERDITSQTLPPLPPLESTDGVEEAAIRARLSSQLFGAQTQPVQISRYTIQHRVGSGGMGVVYAAIDPELGRTVALKVLTHRRSQQPRQRAYLREEARTLARLSHPNIVQIYEVGEHNGAIFLALEFVEGETLLKWQAHPNRTWREILGAYLEAASGIEAAHTVGIIHRDIKPANILVGLDGRIRVADFGLARATPEGMHSDPVGTTDQRSRSSRRYAGTPAYMSPEQASGAVLSPQSDIFSFCISLFEGLYGLHPFPASHPAHLEQDRVSTRQLRKRLPRGSDVPPWILNVLTKGLQPDPEQRFATVGELLRAFESIPRRRRRIFAGTGVTLALTLGAWGLTALTVSPVCPTVSNTIPGVWDQAVKVEMKTAFSESPQPYAMQMWRVSERALDDKVYAWSEAQATSCERTLVEHSQSQEQYDLSSACLREQQQAIAALMTRLVAPTPQTITRALQLVRELGDPAVCTDIQQIRRGPTPPTTPYQRRRVLELQATLEELRILVATAEFSDASQLSTKLEQDAKIYPPLHAAVLYTQGLLASGYGDIARADTLLLQAVDEAEEHRADPLLVQIYGALAQLSITASRNLERAHLYLPLYAAKLRRIEANDTHWADYYDTQGELALLEDQPLAAKNSHQVALDLREAEDILGRARSLKGLANALAETQAVERSIERLQQAKAMLASELGLEHPETAIVNYNLALSFERRAHTGDLIRAEQRMREAFEIERSHSNQDAPGVARTRMGLANILAQQGKQPEAIEQVEQALASLRRTLGPSHVDTRTALSQAFNLYDANQSSAQALAIQTELIQAQRTAGEPVPFEYLINAGELNYQQKRYIEAIPFFDQALAWASLEQPPNALAMIYALNGRAKVHLAQGQRQVAAPLLKRAMQLLPTLEDAPPLLSAEVWWGQAQVLGLTNQTRPEAEKLARDSLEIFRKERLQQVAEIEEFLQQ